MITETKPTTHAITVSVNGEEHSLEVEPRLLLVHLLDLPRMVRERGWAVFREDLGGFAAGVVMVLLLVAGTAIFLAS